MDTKIYIAVAVLSTIFVLLAAFLFYIDLKLRKIQRKKNNVSSDI